MLSITKQLICKLAVLQSQPTVLSLLGILSLDWNFWPLFRDFRRSIKMCEMNYRILFCKSYFVLFLIFIIGTPIFLLHHHIFRDFLVTVLGIFGVSFVRALPAKYDSARTELEVELRKILDFRPSSRKWKIGCVNSFAVKFFWDSLVTSSSLMKYKEQRAHNMPLLKPTKEATLLNLPAIQLEWICI